ncbi:MAG: hypothetical protein IJX05_03575 [Clostridia bacterium]|nr:hypothetical protein [Clostridia bacterium]
MKIKDFFKSNSFKCIVVLLVIALVCGSVLALANDLFYVSPEEAFARSMSKIYDGDATKLEDKIVSEDEQVTYTTYNCSAVILDAQVSPDGKTWLVQSKGDKCGYQGGSLVLWVSMNVENGQLAGLNKIIVDSYDSSQTLIGSISAEYLAQYCSEDYKAIVTGGRHFSNVRMDKENNPADSDIASGGATYTSVAVNAAINGAMDYVREFAGEGV